MVILLCVSVAILLSGNMNTSKFVMIILLVSSLTTTICYENLVLLDEDTQTYKTDIATTPKWLSHYWLIAAALITSQGSILLYLGQPIISRTGGLQLWCGDVYGRENSQHLTDWYTFTHIIHGVSYYWILGLLTPRSSMSLRFIIAVAMEVLWEVMENTPMVINRYRRTALANGYSGLFGFYISKVLPSPLVIAYTIFSELLCAFTIRDNLTLNMIQLIHPIEGISQWQTDHYYRKEYEMKI